MKKQRAKLPHVLLTGIWTSSLTAMCLPAYGNQHNPSSPVVLIPWQTHNYSMQSVPGEYNRYHHIVGAPFDKLLLTGPVVRGDSAFASLPTGPYGAATAIEVRFENKKSRTVQQFRFLQKRGERYETGDYSTWQKDDMGPPYEVENTSDWYSQLLLSSENFDSKEWKIKIGLRWTQIWNLLHAYPLIGMDRIQIQKLLGKGNVDDTHREDDVVSYQLGEQTDLITSLPRLELKYHNNHVIAFQVEN